MSRYIQFTLNFKDIEEVLQYNWITAIKNLVYPLKKWKIINIGIVVKLEAYLET